MKINEILISEAGFGQSVGQAVGGVAQGVGKAAGKTVKAAGDFHSGFKAGQKKMDKWLSPSKWFGGDDDNAAKSKPTDTLKTRQALTRAGTKMNLYKDDQDELKSLYKQVKSGEISAGADQQALLQAIKAAYNQQPLSNQQQQLLQQYSKNF